METKNATKPTVAEIISLVRNDELVFCDLVNPHDSNDKFTVTLKYAKDRGSAGSITVHDPKTLIELFSLPLKNAQKPLEHTYIANTANYTHYANPLG